MKAVGRTVLSIVATATLVLSASLWPSSGAQARPKSCNATTNADDSGARAYCLRGSGEYRVKIWCGRSVAPRLLTVKGPWRDVNDAEDSYADCPKTYKVLEAFVDKKN